MLAAIILAIAALAAAPAHSQNLRPAHAIAMHGAPALPLNFTHLPYADPNAPKNGELNIARVGTFNSLNPFIIRGSPDPRVRSLVYESLMARSFNEPFTLYPLLARSLETPPSRAWASFNLHPDARFSDNRPVTPQDVVFSWETLRNHGRPNHRRYYSQVLRTEIIPPRSVRFHFANPNNPDRELPLILGLMPILPKHVHQNQPFDRTSLTPPIGSGPYLVSHVSPSKRLVYQKNPNWWGQNLPVNRGRYNFQRIVHNYYRDDAAAFQAFKAGLHNLHVETNPARWAGSYNFPDVQNGVVRKLSFSTGSPSGMLGVAFNTRRPPLNNPLVRQALLHLFDFPSLNIRLFHGAYARTNGLFDRSELSSFNRPASPYERSVLSSIPNHPLPKSLLDGTYRLPSPSQPNNRDGRRKASRLFSNAGWNFKNGALRNAQNQPFRMEILAGNLNEERIALSFIREINSLGAQASLRSLDAAQLQQRRQTFDFDALFAFWGASLSPGNEQAFYWGSQAADAHGSRNYSGIKSPHIDAAVKALTLADNRADLVDAARLLERLLLAGAYMLPLYHPPKQTLAVRNNLAFPPPSLYGYVLDAWWSPP